MCSWRSLENPTRKTVHEGLASHPEGVHPGFQGSPRIDRRDDCSHWDIGSIQSPPIRCDRVRERIPGDEPGHVRDHTGGLAVLDHRGLHGVLSRTRDGDPRKVDHHVHVPDRTGRREVIGALCDRSSPVHRHMDIRPDDPQPRNRRRPLGASHHDHGAAWDDRRVHRHPPVHPHHLQYTSRQHCYILHPGLLDTIRIHKTHRGPRGDRSHRRLVPLHHRIPEPARPHEGGTIPPWTAVRTRSDHNRPHHSGMAGPQADRGPNRQMRARLVWMATHRFLENGVADQEKGNLENPAGL